MNTVIHIAHLCLYPVLFGGVMVAAVAAAAGRREVGGLALAAAALAGIATAVLYLSHHLAWIEFALTVLVGGVLGVFGVCWALAGLLRMFRTD